MSPPGLKVRPTSSKVRSAALNMLQGELNGARLLDLFAGSGAVGIEALSRGASGCVFVESDREAIRLLRKNVDGIKERAIKINEIITPLEILPADVRKIWAGLASWAPFDLVWADPPYRDINAWLPILGPELLKVTSIDATLAIETGLMKDVSPQFDSLTQSGWRLFKERSYGETKLTLWNKG